MPATKPPKKKNVQLEAKKELLQKIFETLKTIPQIIKQSLNATLAHHKFSIASTESASASSTAVPTQPSIFASSESSIAPSTAAPSEASVVVPNSDSASESPSVIVNRLSMIPSTELPSAATETLMAAASNELPEVAEEPVTATTIISTTIETVKALESASQLPTSHARNILDEIVNAFGKIPQYFKDSLNEKTVLPSTESPSVTTESTPIVEPVTAAALIQTTMHSIASLEDVSKLDPLNATQALEKIAEALGKIPEIIRNSLNKNLQHSSIKLPSLASLGLSKELEEPKIEPKADLHLMIQAPEAIETLVNVIRSIPQMIRDSMTPSPVAQLSLSAAALPLSQQWPILTPQWPFFAPQLPQWPQFPSLSELPQLSPFWPNLSSNADDESTEQSDESSTPAGSDRFQDDPDVTEATNDPIESNSVLTEDVATPKPTPISMDPLTQQFLSNYLASNGLPIQNVHFVPCMCPMTFGLPANVQSPQKP